MVIKPNRGQSSFRLEGQKEWLIGSAIMETLTPWIASGTITKLKRGTGKDRSKSPEILGTLVAVAIEKSKATAYAYTAATKKLELAENKIKHLEQKFLNFVFGKDDCCGERFYKGLLDEIMMFERTLNKAEIMQLATIGLNVEAKNKIAHFMGDC